MRTLINESVVSVREAAMIARLSPKRIRWRLRNGILRGCLDPPMRVSVSSLADYLSTTAEAVCRTLAELRGLKVSNDEQSSLPLNGRGSAARRSGASRTAAGPTQSCENPRRSAQSKGGRQPRERSDTMRVVDSRETEARRAAYQRKFAGQLGLT